MSRDDGARSNVTLERKLAAFRHAPIRGAQPSVWKFSVDFFGPVPWYDLDGIDDQCLGARVSKDSWLASVRAYRIFEYTLRLGSYDGGRVEGKKERASLHTGVASIVKFRKGCAETNTS
ncbi:hypothetical protein FGADI_1716 [Fusarium gaditjirri]|uniref:Uncharacterized protein n=1 Tax=Fusarium gaditjirri TaxID=282569 RepID=A0A8H4TKG4_9HYPO|nr:hypothetical protein FGADI_1716 [Fusarium gaditjirri]